MSETLIQSMGDEEQQKYMQLRELNVHLLAQLNDGQGQLEQLATKKMELESDLSNSQVI